MMTFSSGNIYQNNITVLKKQGTDYCFTANLVSIRNQEENEQIADNITTNFTVITTGLENETEIICQNKLNVVHLHFSTFQVYNLLHA